MDTMKNRVLTFAVRLLFIVLALTFVAKADTTLTTWDFSFYTIDPMTDQPNGVATGAGSFQTVPGGCIVGGNFVSCDPALYSEPIPQGLIIVSTEGTFNGESMGWVDDLSASEIYNAIDAIALTDPGAVFAVDQEVNYAFYFTAGGTEYYIIGSDQPPVVGPVLFGVGLPLNSYGGNGQLLDFTLTEEPVCTPEASSFVMLLTGLVSVGLFWKRRVADPALRF